MHVAYRPVMLVWTRPCSCFPRRISARRNERRFRSMSETIEVVVNCISAGEGAICSLTGVSHSACCSGWEGSSQKILEWRDDSSCAQQHSLQVEGSRWECNSYVAISISSYSVVSRCILLYPIATLIKAIETCTAKVSTSSICAVIS